MHTPPHIFATTKIWLSWDSLHDLHAVNKSLIYGWNEQKMTQRQAANPSVGGRGSLRRSETVRRVPLEEETTKVSKKNHRTKEWHWHKGSRTKTKKGRCQFKGPHTSKRRGSEGPQTKKEGIWVKIPRKTSEWHRSKEPHTANESWFKGPCEKHKDERKTA